MNHFLHTEKFEIRSSKFSKIIFQLNPIFIDTSTRVTENFPFVFQTLIAFIQEPIPSFIKISLYIYWAQ